LKGGLPLEVWRKFQSYQKQSGLKRKELVLLIMNEFFARHSEQPSPKPEPAPEPEREAEKPDAEKTLDELKLERQRFNSPAREQELDELITNLTSGV